MPLTFIHFFFLPALTYTFFCLLSPLLLPRLNQMLFSRTNHLPVASRLVVITGGSRGTGLALATLLASKGAHIAIIARSPSALASALTAVSAAAISDDQRFRTVSADLCTRSEIERALAEIEAWYGAPPDIVWQVHGGTEPRLFIDATAEQLDADVTMNYTSAMHLAHAVLQNWVAAPKSTDDLCLRRQLLFTSSVAAFLPLAGYNVYTPNKAALRALADGLRQECLLYDIEVRCVFPGTIYTEGYEKEKETKPEITQILEGADAGMSAESVAKVCVARLEAGETSVVVDFLGSVLRSAMWGSTKRGGWGVWDTIVGVLGAPVWAIAGRVLDGQVRTYRKKVEKEEGKFK